MTKPLALSLSLVLLLTHAFPVFGSHDTLSKQYPTDINRYEFLRYSGGQEILSVDAVIRADNNWEILLACLGGKTREELQAIGVEINESQLMLLSVMRFVEVKKEAGREKIVTIMPILGLNKKQALIQRVRSVTREVELVVRDDLSLLIKTLRDAGHEDRASDRPRHRDEGERSRVPIMPIPGRQNRCVHRPNAQS